MRATRPLFLERHLYRRRRLMDAARLLPVLGLGLVAMPLLWLEPPAGDAAAGRPVVPTAATGIYLFAVWFGLIAAAYLLARRLRPKPGAEAEGDG